MTHENHTMISYDEALSIARSRYPGEINRCVEYESAFMFLDRNAPLSFGGCESPIVILKEGGRAINQTAFYDEYLIRTKSPSEILREFDIEP